MSNEEQQIAIATACGWTNCHVKLETYGHANPKPFVYGCPPGNDDVKPVRNYPVDLNAMNEAEKTLSSHLRNDFIANLWKVTGNEPSVNFWTEYNFRGLYTCIHATATQRSEAFLRCLNLWTE